MLRMIVVGGAVVAILGYAWTTADGANEYAMTTQATYDKLMATEFKKGGSEAWGRTGAEKSGNGSNRITFSGWGECTLDIVPDGAARAALSVTCPNMGEGAAAGMTTALRRHMLIEWIDAAMTDRPYDKQRGIMGTTAGRWPDDVVEHGGLVDAQADALKMSAEAQRASSSSSDSEDEDESTAGLGYSPDPRGSGAGGNGGGVDRSHSYGSDPTSRTSY